MLIEEHTMKKKITLLALFTAMIVFFIPVNAQDTVTRVHRFDLTGIEELEINNAVGKIELRLVEGDEMRLELEIEAQEGFFFRRSRDLDEVHLDIEERNERISLSLEEEKVSAYWIIEVPALAEIDIDMGVGEIDAEIGASRLDIELGVGEVEVFAQLAETGDIEVSSGIGDARIRGAHDVSSSRNVVSEDSEGRGEGDFAIEVEVGVGSARVTVD